MLASDALDSLKRRTSLPSSQDLFSDADLLSFINEEHRSNITPWISKQREEHLTKYKDYTVTSGEAFYDIPTRAFQNKLRDVQIIENGTTKSLNRYWEEDRGMISSSEGFFIVGNEIELYPVPTRTFTLRVLFDRRPSKLVVSTSVALISSINTGNSQVTVQSLPSTIISGSTIDLVNQDSPHFAHDDILITGISGLTITLATIPDDLAVGDYLCKKGETPLIQLPEEMANMVIQAAAVKIYESMQKFDAMKAAGEMLQMMKQGMVDALNPRVQGESKKIRPNALSRFRRW